MGICKDVDFSEGWDSGREYMFTKDNSWCPGSFFHFLAPVLLLYSYTFPETVEGHKTQKVNDNELTKYLFIPQSVYEHLLYIHHSDKFLVFSSLALLSKEKL